MIFILYLLCGISVDAHLVPFEPERLRLVDAQKNNLLFRSGSPLNKELNNINWTSIVNTMSQRALREKFVFPDNFVTYDFSLLNPLLPDDNMCLSIEKNFFTQFRNGSMINYIVKGESTSPYDIRNITERIMRARSFADWSTDQLPYFIGYLNLVMSIRFSEQPSVFLIHCMQGVDRTGEVIGAYEMKRFGKSLEDIISEDSKINNNHMAPSLHNLNALMWYELCIQYNGRYC